jgi:hypothetical protein
MNVCGTKVRRVVGCAVHLQAARRAREADGLKTCSTAGMFHPLAFSISASPRLKTRLEL